MEEKKISPIEVVERYHKRYLEYEAAFAKSPFDEERMKSEIMEMAKKDMDIESDEFVEKMFEIVDEKVQKRVEVNNAAFKFMLFVDFYLLTEKEELPEEIIKDYEKLPIKDMIKPQYSIENGEFVPNEKIEIPEERKQYFKSLYKHFKEQEE